MSNKIKSLKDSVRARVEAIDKGRVLYTAFVIPTMAHGNTARKRRTLSIAG